MIPHDHRMSNNAGLPHRKILLLSVSAGAGHTRAAEAIRCCAAGSGVTAIHLDVMDFVTPVLRKIYTDFHISLVSRAPTLWGYLYQVTNRAQPDGIMQRARRWLERQNARRLLTAISAFKPDAIICTHFLPAEILSGLTARGELACPVWVQVTDFDLHRMWVHEHMAGYFAANDEVAFRMRDLGIAADAIHVVGIPIMPVFAQPLARSACAREFGLDPHKATLLLMGGGAGLGSLEKTAQRLLAADLDFQLIVLAGNNGAALAALRQLALRHPGRLWAQGHTKQVERLMACVDVVITKSGGLTTAECLALGLPMIINAPIPGQEERNADFLLEQGVALKATDGATLEYRVRHLLAHPEKLKDMRARAWALGLPHAAQDVLDTVLDNLMDQGMNDAL
jgi:processive 1,2-diacylglycerol beta-glucosyltransferase